MKIKAIASMLILIFALSAFGCAVEEAPAPTPTPTPTPEAGIPTKMPEDVIPLTVPGFSFIEKSDRVLMRAFGEEYYAYSFFVPEANSKFWNKVHSLEVRVYLFEDDASGEAAFDILTVGGTSSTEIQVNSARAILTYDADFGEAAAIQQQGRLVILSDSIPPFEATIFDEQVLKDAAIEGLKAIRL